MIKAITLKAATILSDWQFRKMDPQEIDNYIRQDLAQQFVDSILNEDLIQIYTDKDSFTNTFTARAQLKIIQE